MRLVELAASFLRLGVLAFGGPAVHIAMMRQEFVQRRNWLTEQEFLDRLGFSNMIPGPSSTELAIHIGLLRGGWPGLAIAGCCFILPAAFLTAALAAAYVRLGALPEVDRLLAGVKPVVIAIVLQALCGLVKASLKSPVLWVLAVLAGLLFAFGVSPVAVLAVCGIASWAAARIDATPRLQSVAAPGLLTIFLTFAKIGSVLFGSGYVLLAFLRDDLVGRTHWLTEKQLLDAVAVGQLTPGPVFTTATFIGYLLARWQGAAVATAGIFLPAFLFVAISGLAMAWLRRSRTVRSILDGVNAGSVALMAVALWYLGRSAITGWSTAVIAVVSGILLVRFKVNTAWLILGGALAGVATQIR